MVDEADVELALLAQLEVDAPVPVVIVHVGEAVSSPAGEDFCPFRGVAAGPAALDGTERHGEQRWQDGQDGQAKRHAKDVGTMQWVLLRIGRFRLIRYLSSADEIKYPYVWTSATKWRLLDNNAL
jgi:hypothetical protein